MVDVPNIRTSKALIFSLPMHLVAKKVCLILPVIILFFYDDQLKETPLHPKKTLAIGSPVDSIVRLPPTTSNAVCSISGGNWWAYVTSATTNR